MQRRDAVDRVRCRGRPGGPCAPGGRASPRSATWRQAARRRRRAAARTCSRWRRVQQVDDLHVPRQQPLHQRHRPGLQRLGQQRVVGVGNVATVMRQASSHSSPCTSISRRISSMTAIAGWVSLSWIAALSARLSQRAELVEMPAQQVLQRGGGEEELLAQPQLLPGVAVVAGIQHAETASVAHPLAQGAHMVAAVERSRCSGVSARADHSRSVLAVLAAAADHRRVVGDGRGSSRPGARHSAAARRPRPA